MDENKDYIIQIVDLEEGKTQYISYISENNFEITSYINEAKRMPLEKAVWYCNNTLKIYETRLHKVALVITSTIMETNI